MYTHSQALELATVDELKAIASALALPLPVGPKAKLVAHIVQQFAGQGLARLWARMDDLQRAAVGQSLYAPGTVFDAQKFVAQYGAEPAFSVTPSDKSADQRFSRATRPGERTLLGLFLLPDGMRRLAVPSDLAERLRAFVAEPAEASLPVVDALPDSLEGQPLAIRATEREALVDLPVLLRLADQAKLQFSDKTFLPSAPTRQLLGERLSGGDFYGDDGAAAAMPYAQPIGAIKAVGWSLLLQSAGLLLRGGGKSALSPAGRKALALPAAEVLRAMWHKWLKTGAIDEFSRIDAIKGQKSKGRVMTAVAPRRLAITAALQSCPVGQWVSVAAFGRWMQAVDLDFEITHDPWKLYIVESGYGSLGYAGSNGWPILQQRYLQCLLFEYAAVLGIIDVAYIDPAAVKADFRHLWGADELSFLSRYDGLAYFRLTPLGAYCLDLVDHYSPAAPTGRTVLAVLPSLTVQVRSGSLSQEEALVLDTWAQPLGEASWQLDRQKAMSALERGHDADSLREFLQARDDQPLPETVDGFLRQVRRMGKALRVLGPALLMECLDAEIADRIATHSDTAALCTRIDEVRLLVRNEHEARFRARVRALGFGLSG